MEDNIKYQITIQGVDFFLSRPQIDFDGPNYFTDYFFGDWIDAPPGERRIELPWRDPGLFPIIISYLSGYPVIPLDERVAPEHVSLTRTLLNLRADARFYRLNGLVDACDEQLERMDIDDVPKKRYLVITTRRTFPNREVIYYADNLAEIVFHERYVGKTQITDANLAEPLFDEMNMLGSVKDFDGLRSAGAAERFIARSLDDYNPCRYRLVGWQVKGKRYSHEVDGLVVCEDWGMD
ncbi:hypothetical protein FRC11_013066 [Ceratobasidium sp. 423]|nr:hypothetical protein FRC11_013066 [Ceratobasidium sp. 423]